MADSSRLGPVRRCLCSSCADLWEGELQCAAADQAVRPDEGLQADGRLLACCITLWIRGDSDRSTRILAKQQDHWVKPHLSSILQGP